MGNSITFYLVNDTKMENLHFFSTGCPYSLSKSVEATMAAELSKNSRARNVSVITIGMTTATTPSVDNSYQILIGMAAPYPTQKFILKILKSINVTVGQ